MNTTLASLRREIEASRREIPRDFSSLRRELDFVSKTKRTVARRPLPWLGGVAALGFLLAGRRPAKSPKLGRGEPALAEPAKKLTILGVLIAAARFLFPIFRPALLAFATRKLSGLAGNFRP